VVHGKEVAFHFPLPKPPEPNPHGALSHRYSGWADVMAGVTTKLRNWTKMNENRICSH